MPKIASQSSRSGFSMVEIMVVVVLIGIMSAIAVPRFMASTGLSQLDGDVNKMTGLIQLGRTRAVTTGKMHFLTFNTTNRAVTLQIDTDGSNTLNAGDVVVQSDTLGSAVRYGFGSNWTAVPATAPAGVTGFSATTVPTGGLAAGVAGTNPGTECGQGATGTTVSGTWADGINFCPGVLGDVETGALYLSTSRSEARAYAIIYNDLGANAKLRVQRFRWMGGTWESN